MKFDGHVKLTSKAISIMKTKCPVTTGSCSAPMFDEDFRIWLHSNNKSTPTDNYTAAILNYISAAVTPDKISTIKLPDAVAFVDLDERWTHDDPKGQRYHFMKASGETNQTSFFNAVSFIQLHTLNWVDNARKILKHETAMYKDKVVRPLQQSGVGLNNFYVKELALALHSLQDSFSPAHTERYSGSKKVNGHKPSSKKHTHSGLTMPIRKLHVYANQHHDKHGDSDYLSGGTSNDLGRMAASASADLMLMGIESLWKVDKGLIGWNQFKSKWLASNFL